jgi:hypothetical protein
VGPKRDEREKFGEVITAVVAGTNTAKGEFHGSDVLLKGGSLSDHTANIASDFAGVTNLTRGFVVFADDDGSVTGKSDVSHQDTKPFDEFGNLSSSAELGFSGAASKSGLFLAEPPDSRAKHEDESASEANGFTDAAKSGINEAFRQRRAKTKDRTGGFGGLDVVREGVSGEEGSNRGHVHGGESERQAIRFGTHGDLFINDSRDGASDVKFSSDGGDGVNVTFKIGMKARDAVRRTATHDAAVNVFSDEKDNALKRFEVCFARCGLEAGKANKTGH